MTDNLTWKITFEDNDNDNEINEVYIDDDDIIEAIESFYLRYGNHFIVSVSLDEDDN